jgi:hypothetical protein
LNLKQPKQKFLLFQQEKHQFKLLSSDQNFKEAFENLLEGEPILGTRIEATFESNQLSNKIIVNALD